MGMHDKYGNKISVTNDSRPWPALVAQWAKTLTELQCRPGWLARRRGFDSCCRHVESGFCMQRD